MEIILFVWRRLCIVSLFLTLGCTASADDDVADCGTVLGSPNRGETIYVYCPSLPKLSEKQARNIIVAVLDNTSRLAGETQLLFLSDPSVLDRDWQYQNMEKRLESWGDAFIGAYHTHSSLLTVRSASENEWRDVYLPIR